MNAIASSRRTFLIATLSAAGGLAIGFTPFRARAASAIAGAPWDLPDVAEATEVGPWVEIDPDNSVLIRIAKQEMGQGVFTSMAMIIAEELECDWAKVRVEYASANRSVSHDSLYGSMGTGGSSSVRRSREMLQLAGATARERLIAAAAQRWGVAPTACTVANGQVMHQASGRSLTFGDVAGAAAAATLANPPKIKSPDQYKLLGTSVPRFDVKVKTTGEAQFGIDTRVPGMFYASVSACPVFGGTLASADESAIAGRRGIKQVVKLPDAVAVVADSFWRAKQALADLPITWNEGEAAKTSSEEFKAEYRAALDGPAANARRDGDVATAMAGAAKKVEALYEAPHLAHATMEPLNCTAHVRADGHVDIWMGTQAP
ncbi:MAG TPA: molybdopterin cofactor-binding domain-containing protein, partial [Acetobacteraceae bacterium]|nr:molybdopterin cofactor-binding domain-containing protein [Acetobacteraceae bacterium]